MSDEPAEPRETLRGWVVRLVCEILADERGGETLEVAFDRVLARVGPPPDRYAVGYNDAVSTVIYALRKTREDGNTMNVTRGSSIDPVVAEIDALVMRLSYRNGGRR